MKKITALILTLAVVAGLSACGAKTTNEPSAEPETASVAEETTAEATTAEETTAEETTAAAAQETTAESKTAAPEMSGAWAAAYREYLLSVLPGIFEEEFLRNNNDLIRFGLIDLNDDDVPELWYNDDLGAHGPNYVIRTYRDGKVAEVGEGFTVMDYYEKQGVFAFTASGGASGFETTYFKMTATGSKQTDVYAESVDMASPPDENGNMPVTRTLNGAVVSEAEHQAFLDRYAASYGQPTRLDGEKDGFPLTEGNILAHCK